MQGEDNAAEVRFVIPEGCPLKGMSLYLETVDAAGIADRTDVLFLEEDGVSHPVPLAWTQNGGTTSIRLVAENEGVVAYTLEAALYFDNRQTGRESAAGQFRSSIQKMYAKMRDMYNRIMVMAAEGGFEPGYADHLKNIRNGEAVYVWSGTKEQLEKEAAYLPKGTLVFLEDDGTVERLEKLIGERAPGDCGLGSAKKVDDPDEACRPGFYYCQNVTIDEMTFGGLYMTVDATSDGTKYAHQTVHTTGNPGFILHRTKQDGVWQPWEWEHPPMKEDVEYRITERWEGKVLYVYHTEIDVSSLAGKGGKISGNLGLGDAIRIVRATLYTDTRILPRSTVSSGYQQDVDINRLGSYVYTAGADVTDKKLYIDSYYYKTEG